MMVSATMPLVGAKVIVASATKSSPEADEISKSLASVMVRLSVRLVAETVKLSSDDGPLLKV